MPILPRLKSARPALKIILIAALLVSLLTAGVYMTPVAGHQDTGGWERILMSDDGDPASGNSDVDSDNPEAINDISEDRGGMSLAKYAKQTDMAFGTTNPRLQVNGQSVAQIRRDRLRSMSWNKDRTIKFPMTPGLSDKVMIRDAHVTIMGANGGGYSEFNPSFSQSPFVLGRSGEILTHTDFRVDESQIPDNYCGQTSYNTVIHNHGNATNPDYEIHYLGGTKICHEYETKKKIQKKLVIGGRQKTWKGSSPDHHDVMPFDSGLTSGQAGMRELRVEVKITFTVKHYRVPKSFVNTDGIHNRNGVWTETNREQVGKQETELVVEDSRQALISGGGSLEVEQKVVNVGEDEKNLVLEFNGGQSLSNRILWSRLTMGDGTYVRSTLSTYTTQKYKKGTKIYEEDGEVKTKRVHKPHLLKMHIFSGQRTASIIQQDVSRQEAGPPRIMGTEKYNFSVFPQPPSLSGGSLSFQSNTPAAFEKMVILNAKDSVSAVESVHGVELDIVNTEVVPYHQADASIEKIGGRRVAITVTNSKTGEPLVGRQVHLTGTEQGSAVTNSSGVVTARVASGHVQATIPGDEWTSPCAGDGGDCVFIGGVQASRTLLPASTMLDMAKRFVMMSIVAVPVVFLLFWWRSHSIAS